MTRNTAHGTGPLPGTTPMRWSKLPHEREWMLEHAGKMPIPDVIEAFEREFGIRLRKTQVSLFRAEHGLGSRQGCTARSDRLVPVGTERVGKDGYIMVKVRDRPSVPMSKDNWVQKQRHVYAQAHGEVPGGCVVMFADGDKRNFDPGNLVAVPRKYIARLNAGPAWHDAESLRACMALCDLDSAVRKAVTQAPRKCGVCGAEFVPDASDGATNLRTCRACLDAGHMAQAMHGSAGGAVCAVCGRTFARDKKSQRRCRECISREPRLSPGQHARKEGK